MIEDSTDVPDSEMAGDGKGGSIVPGTPFIGGLVSARGTGDGLILRLDGRASSGDLQLALVDFISSRKGFLSGTDVAVEWVGRLPDAQEEGVVRELLSGRFGMVVREFRSASRTGERAEVTPLRVGQKSEFEADDSIPDSELHSAASTEAGAERAKSWRERNSVVGREMKGSNTNKGAGSSSLFGGLELIDSEVEEVVSKPRSGRASAGRGFDPSQSMWDDADARVIYGTLRSGQRVESEHTVVVCGDVNSGAEIIAGGDIVVLGILRGVAHAGAYDETGGGRFIFALSLQPTQLRIGSTITRGSGEGSGSGAEIARVDGSLIVVEPYQAKNLMSRR